jgi:hypothetical protein
MIDEAEGERVTEGRGIGVGVEEEPPPPPPPPPDEPPPLLVLVVGLFK